MECEVPVCSRCCFCLPLRYGLIAWSYFKLMVDALISAMLTFLFFNLLLALAMNGGDKSPVNWIFILVLLTLAGICIYVTDFVMTIVFIVAGHKKNVKTIRVYYFFSMGMWIVTTLLTFMSFTFFLENMLSKLRSWERILITISAYVLVLVVQTYFLLLLRSEIIKLNKKCEFRFLNNTGEAECAMKYDGEVAAEETDTFPNKEHVNV